MLRFQTPPDKIFMAILTESMEMMIDQMRETLSVHREKEVDTVSLESLMPNASRVFAPETALKILKRMLHCHKGPGFYRLNDYHFLLLYDVLGYFCDIHNDMVHTTPHAEEKNRASRIAGVHIEKINFNDLIAMYFYDTDFLLDADTMLNLGIDKRKALGIHEETFGLSQGLAPHPEEFRLKEEKEDVPELRITSRFWSPGSKVYPDLKTDE
jgi:hypothetical protein